MATAVIMPRQGQSVESCLIGKWHKQVGDTVKVGDLLFTYETDKSTFDEEAKLDGVLLAAFFGEGDDVPCLVNVCVIGNAGESFADFAPTGADSGSDSAESSASEKTSVAETSAPVETAKTVVRSENDFIKISPRAKGLADKFGVDILSTPATGPSGRIIERDIKAQIDSGNVATSAAKAGFQGASGIEGTGLGGRVTTADLRAGKRKEKAVKTAPEFVEVKHSGIRKAIAKSMHASLSNMAQLTLHSSFDITDVQDFRGKVKANAEKMGLPNVTLNDILIYAVSRVIANHPDCNAHYFDDKIVQFRDAHIGMAVDTPRGLMVPTIFAASDMTLSEISANAKSIAKDCTAGSINPDQLKGGTFTVTNLGTLGVETFTPVINPPQTCILGVGTIETKIRAYGAKYRPYESIALSLTFDHRAVDGAPAARFLKDLVNYLENFSFMLASELI